MVYNFGYLEKKIKFLAKIGPILKKLFKARDFMQLAKNFQNLHTLYTIRFGININDFEYEIRYLIAHINTANIKSK